MPVTGAGRVRALCPDIGKVGLIQLVELILILLGDSELGL
jgi:hypothetical protein